MTRLQLIRHVNVPTSARPPTDIIVRRFFLSLHRIADVGRVPSTFPVRLRTRRRVFGTCRHARALVAMHAPDRATPAGRIPFAIRRHLSSLAACRAIRDNSDAPHTALALGPDGRGHRVVRGRALAWRTGAGLEGGDVPAQSGAAGPDSEEAAREVPGVGHMSQHDRIPL